jgi:hypothetical protein
MANDNVRIETVNQARPEYRVWDGEELISVASTYHEAAEVVRRYRLAKQTENEM